MKKTHSKLKVKKIRKSVISDEKIVEKAIRDINNGASGIRVMSALAPKLQAKVKRRGYNIKREHIGYKRGIKTLAELSPLTREIYGLDKKKKSLK